MENFDLRKYLAEGKLFENALAQKLRDEAKHPDSKVGAAIFNKYAKKIENADKADYKKIIKAMESELISKHPDTFNGEDDIPGSFLSEGKLFEEDFKNPILDKYLKLKKSIDNKTVFDYELSDFINDLDNTERKGLERDLGLERDELYEGVIKENITKLDNYALEIYSDFRKDPSIHFPDVEFEVDEEGFALENDSNYSQLKKYKREIMGLHALFGEESGVKDKNGLQLSMYDVINNI